MIGVSTILPDGSVIQGDHKTPVGAGLVNVSTLNWSRIANNKKTGVYLNDETQMFEFRCFYNKTDYVIIGACARITQDVDVRYWSEECIAYVRNLSEAN